MTNKKSSFLIKFIILSTLVLAFILVLLGIIFNNLFLINISYPTRH
ncbi:hypothetical protein ACISNS_06160, partial [Campylobacter jejuni]